MPYMDPEQDVLAASKRARKNIVIMTSCPKCGVSYTKKCPWFEAHDFKCPTCGVEFDKKPFVEMAQRASQRLQDALKRALGALAGLFLTLAFQGIADPLDVWNIRSNSGGQGGQSVAYGNGTFVALAGPGGLMVSPDGATWTQYVSPPVLSYEGIVFGGGLFVTYGHLPSTNSLGPQYILFSGDGLSWTNAHQTSFQIRAAAFGNNRLVLVGDGIISATVSPLAWSEFQPPGFPLYGVTYGIGRFVAAGSNPGANRAYILSSADGVVWRYDYGPISTQTVSGIAYGNGMFITSWRTNNSDNNYPSGFLVSTDLLGWTSITVASNTFGLPDPGAVVFGGGQFIAPIYQKTYTSSNGFAWVRRSEADGGTAFAYGRGSFVAVTGGGINQSDVFAVPTNPPLPNLEIASYPGVTVNGTEGLTYRIDYTTNLGQGSVWVPITNLTLPVSPYLWIDTTSPILTRRFYRAVQID